MQGKLKTYVQNLINNNNNSGSILFYGINNGPKFSIAEYTIQMLNCYEPKNQEPCGACISCEKIKAFNHPDLHIVIPFSNDKKTENKAFEDQVLNFSFKTNSFDHFLVYSYLLLPIHQVTHPT